MWLFYQMFLFIVKDTNKKARLSGLSSLNLERIVWGWRRVISPN